ncbi:hypothetical protein HCU64_03985 [Methylobacterium sp. C25]|uniref:hypothetical protein n=1 Tax=Methylobacterium sp. C25 TaxID=2721622 RepID=UPI001F3797FC|nr:hypothetical protein [Methylobacterium sp. C25]MCE4222902.1 hypothetical protein [Methylobacterium sp. C25]
MSRLSDDVLRVLEQAAPAGLKRVAERRWVGDPSDGIRPLFEFQALKGNQYSARWGFSVDFVPRLHNNGRLAWKRTAGTAFFDLTIDPLDAATSKAALCLLSRDDSLRRVEARMGGVRRAASADLSSVVAVEDLLALFRRRAALANHRFSLANYVQTDLAWGLLLWATGHGAEGSERLSRWCVQFGIDPEAPILRQAREDAQRTTGQ